MASFDYIAWHSRLPVWLRIPLWPILVTIMLIHTAVVATFVCLVRFPFGIVTAWCEDRRLWRRLREQERVVAWSEVEPQVISGNGTLLQEVFPNGLGYTWFIDRPRNEIDPEGVLWSSRDWKNRDASNEQYWARLNDEAIKRWSNERLVDFAVSACVVMRGWKSDRKLEDAALVVPGWFTECLRTHV